MIWLIGCIIYIKHPRDIHVNSNGDATMGHRFVPRGLLCINIVNNEVRWLMFIYI